MNGIGRRKCDAVVGKRWQSVEAQMRTFVRCLSAKLQPREGRRSRFAGPTGF